AEESHVAEKQVLRGVVGLQGLFQVRVAEAGQQGEGQPGAAVERGQHVALGTPQLQGRGNGHVAAERPERVGDGNAPFRARDGAENGKVKRRGTGTIRRRTEAVAGAVEYEAAGFKPQVPVFANPAAERQPHAGSGGEIEVTFAQEDLR